MIYYQHDTNFITVMGQTYTHRNSIKMMGGIFVPATKSWRLPYSVENLNAVDRFCRQHGGGPSAAPETAKETVQDYQETVPKDLIAENSEDAAASPVGNHDPNGYRVSELLDWIGSTISRTFSSPLWILGEVQNMGRKGRGIFFNLAEQANAQVAGSTLSISAVMWMETFSRLEKKFGQEKISELLQDGLTLRVLCQVTFYKGRASLSLNVIDMDPQYTQGALALAREMLLKDLRSKGLDLLNKKRPLSAFPFKVGLITAENSRAESDFLHQLEQGRFCGSIVFCSAAMQGEHSPREVCAALKTLIRANCDVIVLTRGGGSAADLRWFDTPEIAYAIVHSPIPIVAAIGHHDDRCVAEEICFQREKTPTAAAEFILECFEKTETRIENCVTVIQQRLDDAYNTLFEKQNFLKERLKSSANDFLVSKQKILASWQAQMILQVERQISKARTRVSELCNSLHWNSKMLLEKFFAKTQELSQTFQNHDPRPWLKRGWTQIWQEQKQVQSLEDINVGSSVWARLLDGVLNMQVTEKIQKKDTSHE